MGVIVPMVPAGAPVREPPRDSAFPDPRRQLSAGGGAVADPAGFFRNSFLEKSGLKKSVRLTGKKVTTYIRIFAK